MKHKSHESQPGKKPPSFEFQTYEKRLFWYRAFVESGSTEKVLGIQIDSVFTFDEHVSSIFNKVGKNMP